MKIKDLGSLFKTLSDQKRLRVLAVLADSEEICACHIVGLLGVSGATVSVHMAQLIQAGLVGSRKEGRWTYYHLKRDKVEIAPMLDWLISKFNLSSQVAEDRERIKALVCSYGKQ